jgi:hypothetical protein
MRTSDFTPSPPDNCCRRLEARSKARFVLIVRFDSAAKNILAPDLLHRPGAHQHAFDLFVDAADQQVALGPLKVLVELKQRHHRGRIQMARILHPQNHHLDLVVVRQIADLLLKQVGGAEKEFALHVDNRDRRVSPLLLVLQFRQLA